MSYDLLYGPVLAAAALGYNWCIVEASHMYSAKACESIGMKLITSVQYDDFEHEAPDGTKEKVFKGMDPWYTVILNKSRPPDKQLKTSASAFLVHEGQIMDMLPAIRSLLA